MTRTARNGINARLLVLLSAVFLWHAAVNAQTVLLVRYDVTAQNGTFSAVCVVPPAGAVATGRGGFCHYVMVGGSVFRDNTSADREAIYKKPNLDTEFEKWFSASVSSVDNSCRIEFLFNGTEWPTEGMLKTNCPNAAIMPVSRKMDGKLRNLQVFADSVRNDLPKKAPWLKTIVVADTTSTMSTGQPTGTRTTAPSQSTTTTDNEGMATATDTSATGSQTTDTSRTDTSDTSATITSTGDPVPPGGGRARDPELSILLLNTVTLAIFAVTLVLSAYRQRRSVRRKLVDYYRNRPEGKPDVSLATLFDFTYAMIVERDEAQRSAAHFREVSGKNAASLSAVIGALELSETSEEAKDPAAVVKNTVGRTRSYEKRLHQLAGSEQQGTATDVETAFQSIEARLQQRQRVEDAIGTRAQSGEIDQYVVQSVELADRFKKRFWRECSGPAEAAAALKEAEKSVRDLYKNLLDLDDSGKVGVDMLSVIPMRFEELKNEIASGRQKAEDAQRILSMMEDRKRTNESAENALKRELGDLRVTRDFIGAQWSGVPVDDLSRAVTQLGGCFSRARKAAEGVGAKGQDFDQLLLDVVDIVSQERESSATVREMDAILRRYLALPPADSLPSLKTITEGEMRGPRRVMRLCLAAAIPELERIAKSSDLNELLRLRLIVDEAQLFLERLIGYDNVSLLETGILSGFSQDWLHLLFRAEVVAKTYFMTRWGALADVLAVIACSFRYVSEQSGISVDRVRLLVPPPANSAEVNSSSEFTVRPEIRRHVQARLKPAGDAFVVDVQKFGMRKSTGAVMTNSTVVLSNLHDWED